MTSQPPSVEIEITREDIDNGSPGKGLNCPVYFAASRKLPNVSVGTTGVGFRFWGIQRWRRMPLEMVCWVNQFDHGFVPLPVKFELPLLGPSSWNIRSWAGEIPTEPNSKRHPKGGYLNPEEWF